MRLGARRGRGPWAVGEQRSAGGRGGADRRRGFRTGGHEGSDVGEGPGRSGRRRRRRGRREDRGARARGGEAERSGVESRVASRGRGRRGMTGTAPDPAPREPSRGVPEGGGVDAGARGPRSRAMKHSQSRCRPAFTASAAAPGPPPSPKTPPLFLAPPPSSVETRPVTLPESGRLGAAPTRPYGGVHAGRRRIFFFVKPSDLARLPHKN